jgi:hypothetical protein
VGGSGPNKARRVRALFLGSVVSREMEEMSFATLRSGSRQVLPFAAMLCDETILIFQKNASGKFKVSQVIFFG